MIARLSITPALMILALCACGEERGEQQGVPINTSIATARVTLPAVAGPSDPALPLVVIDPGHGGRDPGALSPLPGGPQEKDVTLEIARAIRAALVESGQVRVALTRDGDQWIALEHRPDIARRLRASLFISIHADAARREGARGASLYTLSEVASDHEAASLAARENASAIGGSPEPASGEVNRILFDLAQRESLAASAEFARLLHREGEPLLAFQPDYRRFASLIVLKAPDVPSLLFETGYITNEEDAAFLRSDEGRSRIASAVTKAVQSFFARKRFTTRSA